MAQHDNETIPVDIATVDKVDVALGRLDPEALNVIILEIGSCGEMTRSEAQKSASLFRKAAARSPLMKFIVTIGGYDKDRRELWTIPEVCGYVQKWARFAGVAEIDAAIERFHIEGVSPGKLSLGWLAACGAFGPEHVPNPLMVVHDGGKQ